jgi:hypothetical protein
MCQHRVGQRLRQQNAIAGDEPAGLGKPAMSRDEIGAWDAIAVEKHAIGAAAPRDRAIADFGRAETRMLVPHMGERTPQLCAPMRDGLLRRRARSVIRHNDLELPVALPRQSAQHGRKRVGTLVGRDHDGDQLIHYAAPQATPSCSGSRCPRH